MSNAKTKEKTEAVAPAGTATLAAAKPRADVKIFNVRSDIPIPAITSNRGNKSKYELEKLAVGESRGVHGRNAKSMGSTMTIAVKNTMEVKRDENGAIVYKRDQAGNLTNEQEMTKTREFHAADVDPTADPDNASCRIWRIK